MRPKQYLEQAVYQFPFLIGSGHQLDLFSSVGHPVHLSKNKSALLSIPKSNSKIVIRPVLSSWRVKFHQYDKSPQYFLWQIVFPRVTTSHFLSQCVIILYDGAAFCRIVKSSAEHDDFRIPAMPKKRGTAGNLRVSFCLVRCYSGSARRWEKWKI